MTDLGQRLLEAPELLPALSWLALQLESWGWLLEFSPWATSALRTGAVALFAVFHLLVIGTTFHVGLFPLVSAASWLPFLPTAVWTRAAPAPPTRKDFRPTLAGALAGALLIVVALANVRSLSPGAASDGPLRRVERTLRLDQAWSLWSRVMTDRHYVFAARLRDGCEVDLHRGGAPLAWDLPRKRSESNRWWKYQLFVASEAGRSQRPWYARWLRRSWDRRRPEDEAVASLSPWKLEDGAWGRRAVALWRDAPGAPEPPGGAGDAAFAAPRAPR